MPRAASPSSARCAPPVINSTASACGSVRRTDGRGYRFPPLWGPGSFNDGAGMNTFNDAVRFVWRNMPRGVDPRHPQLTPQQAWDVVAYLKTMPRPKDLSVR